MLTNQLVVVYLGVIFKESGEGKQDSRSKIISAVVLVVGFCKSSPSPSLPMFVVCEADIGSGDDLRRMVYLSTDA